MTTRPTLYGLFFSPWTERARWALDHHGIAYRYREHVPMLGEPLLRMRGRRRGGGPATVPLLVCDDGCYGDSFDIMRYADRAGSGPSLESESVEARAWMERIEEGLRASRGRVTTLILGDDEALRESAMAVTPAFLAGAMRPVAALGARYIAGKHGAELGVIDRHERAMEVVLIALRDALAGGDHLCGDTLSAADVMGATFIQSIAPSGASHLALTPAVRRAWTCDYLAGEFEDLVAWRDRLYTAHRAAA